MNRLLAYLLVCTSALTAGCSQVQAPTFVRVPGPPPTATLTWMNPTEYVDGSVFIPELSMLGAIISWGTVAGGEKPNQITVSGAMTGVTVDLPSTPGSYYFDVMVEDVTGTLSAPSEEAVKTVPALVG